ncbi:hypothetical protein G3580_13295 [Nitrogeniibacter mangrovi]|uniref:Right handed beta helix domain-containing protein n=1 Tax=Nitrogeniibacter mangrovi TaxID=2016596 RepID=A0A6C1B710_9RHOO|nr:hypothetical protein [Nitrogeniibacter mangrovi]QID18518.1 hypothetical protein G3580_13295 [Nitrogeniibacter mangrovi]
MPFRRLLLACALIAAPACADTLRVGPNGPIKHIRDAARIARDGDIIDIAPGIYRGDVAVWTQRHLRIRGLGPGVVLEAAGRSAEGKAIWVVRGGTIVIENIEFRGARVPDGNGAGIRFERGDLRIRRCRFLDNENGILTGNTPTARLRVEDSVFGQAPHHPGSLHHLLYVGQIGRFELSGSHLSNGFNAHLVKSRARESLITDNLIDDGPTGRASYELEFPNSGRATVTGNIIGQSAHTTNRILLRYGAEGAIWPVNRLTVVHNTLISRNGLGPAVHVDAPPDARPQVRIEANLFVGSQRLELGPDAIVRDNAFVPQNAFDDGRPAATAYWLDAPVLEPAADSLRPEHQLTPPIGTHPLPPGTPHRAGALQHPPPWP